jgi:hypothetical protein
MDRQGGEAQVESLALTDQGNNEAKSKLRLMEQ